MKTSTAKPSSGPGRASEVARALIRRTKQASRRRFPAEEKIRILLEGIRAELCCPPLPSPQRTIDLSSWWRAELTAPIIPCIATGGHARLND